MMRIGGVCALENSVEDEYLDSSVSFHATYCKEKLEMFNLRYSKVRLACDKTLDITGVGDFVLKTSFGTSWTLKDVRYHIGFGDQQWKVTKGSLVVAHGNKRVSLYMVENWWFGEAEEAFLHNVREDKETAETTAGVAFCVENGIVMLKMVPETPLQFGVAERLSLTFRAESIGLRAKEEWRGKDTSLAHLKVFGCDLFVKVKDVCGEAMKCTFIGSGSDEMRYSFRDTKSHQIIRSRDITFVDSIYGAKSAIDSSSLTKPIQKSQVVLVDILKNLVENDSIVAEHGLSSEITQSPGGSHY
ncbi:hypothetical protein Tco_1080959 [Tanacetum coccineum]|uniref:Retrovirus-related Pol polyprotein from transposon TNT 1-94-like beta-barrel domain-containing protein n=1 Tax=Tanacetum coccineum TaxID=301880 RepID=A0ABQ5HXG9_9ASTR